MIYAFGHFILLIPLNFLNFIIQPSGGTRLRYLNLSSLLRVQESFMVPLVKKHCIDLLLKHMEAEINPETTAGHWYSLSIARFCRTTIVLILTPNIGC